MLACSMVPLQKNITIVTDFGLFFQSCISQHPTMIGITGTNGKSTVTSLLHHVLSGMEPGSWNMGGNIGTAVLDMPYAQGYILEISSAQLEQLALSCFPKISFTHGVLLNIHEDHLSYHRTYARYRKAKESMKHAMNFYSIHGNKIMKEGRCLCTVEQTPHSTEYLFHDGQRCCLSTPEILPINVGCVLTLAKDLGREVKDIVPHIKEYQGLQHRQSIVHTCGNIVFVNDSKATNVHASRTALERFSEIYWLVGGIVDGGSFAYIQTPDSVHNVRWICCFGQDRKILASHLRAMFPCPVIQETSLEDATFFAYNEAKKSRHGGTVLLSPLCKSFDAFRDFEHRGNCFTSLVQRIDNADR